jgi:MFS family permease
MALTGPVLGAIVGGAAINSIGGYNNPKAYNICLAVLTFCNCFAIMIPFTQNVIAASCFFWIQFFGGGFCLPVFTGILLNLLVSPLRTIANSWANMIYNLLGYMPGPIFYGGMMTLSGDRTSKFPMMVLQGISILCVVFLIIAKIVKEN